MDIGVKKSLNEIKMIFLIFNFYSFNYNNAISIVILK